MSVIEVRVPDIGDFDDVAVIEILVQVGQTLAVEQSIITVESDKAAMEIPAAQAGVVQQMHVKLGDRVKQGSLLLTLETAAVAASTATAAATATKAQVPAQASAPKSASAPTATQPFAVAPSASDCDVLILGGGPGGYSAAFRAADLGLKVILVERYAVLGGVCLNVGCIPSKTLLHVAQAIEGAQHLHTLGFDVGSAAVHLAALRDHKNRVISRLNQGLAAMAKMRKVAIVRGLGTFSGGHSMDVISTTGTGQERSGAAQRITFKACIIAAGSRALHLPFMPPDDARIVDSTGALALPSVPRRLLIVGGGIIGLEMGTVYSALGSRLDVVEMQDGLMQGVDRDLVKVWHKRNAQRFDHIMLNTRTVAARSTGAGVELTFEGPNAPPPQTYDLVLQAVGRAPNGLQIGAEAAGVSVSDRGFIAVDVQMRTNVPHIFAIGDIVGQPMLAHKAVHEGHVAAQVVAGELLDQPELASSAFDARVIPGVAYTHPEVAWAGLSEEQIISLNMPYTKGLFPWAASGRAIASGCDDGFTKLLFSKANGRVIGGGMVGPHVGDMIGEVALAIEMGATAADIGKTIHPHPTLGETIGLGAEAAHGICTDLPPVRKP